MVFHTRCHGCARYESTKDPEQRVRNKAQSLEREGRGEKKRSEPNLLYSNFLFFFTRRRRRRCFFVILCSHIVCTDILRTQIVTAAGPRHAKHITWPIIYCETCSSFLICYDVRLCCYHIKLPFHLYRIKCAIMHEYVSSYFEQTKRFLSA